MYQAVVLWGGLRFPPVSTPSALSILLLSKENSDGTQEESEQSKAQLEQARKQEQLRNV